MPIFPLPPPKKKSLTELPTFSFDSFWPACFLLSITSFIGIRKTPLCQCERKGRASSYRTKGWRSGVVRRKGNSHRTHSLIKRGHFKGPELPNSPSLLSFQPSLCLQPADLWMVRKQVLVHKACSFIHSTTHLFITIS